MVRVCDMSWLDHDLDAMTCVLVYGMFVNLILCHIHVYVLRPELSTVCVSPFAVHCLCCLPTCDVFSTNLVFVTKNLFVIKFYIDSVFCFFFF